MIWRKTLTYFSIFWERILQLLFPPLCLYCHEKLPHSRHLYCKGCAAFFELIDPRDYCAYCFGESESAKACPQCLQRRYFRVKSGSALEKMSPPLNFLRHIRSGRMNYLLSLAAHFMTIQYFSFKWDKPDYIVVMRRSWLDVLLMRDPAKAIAKELSKTLQIPTASLSKKKLVDKRILVVDLTLDRIDSVRELCERYQCKRVTYFSLMRSFDLTV